MAKHNVRHARMGYQVAAGMDYYSNRAESLRMRRRQHRRVMQQSLSSVARGMQAAASRLTGLTVAPWQANMLAAAQSAQEAGYRKSLLVVPRQYGRGAVLRALGAEEAGHGQP